jgi:3-hydroxybutyryl-CoA dehydrogenase
MSYAIIQQGESRSFPTGDRFLGGAGNADTASVLIYLGAPIKRDDKRSAVLVELGSECLFEHTGAEPGNTTANVLGFARYRNGADAPSNLVELVRSAATEDSAIAAARAIFESAGLKISVCTDQPGRIIDRLLRPKYNAALRFLDEGLASATDIDTTCKLGLGYPDGPIERVVRGGLEHHYEVTRALFDTYGTAAYAPAARAVAAVRRKQQ